MNEEKVSDLWEWFIANEHQIIDAYHDESLSPYVIESLNNLILDIGKFYWEIGPGKVKSWYLTISPNGDRDLIKISKSIIKHAPDLPDWEFNYCKQAKNWDRKFMIYDNNMDEQPVDASNWKYITLPGNEGRVTLKLEAANISHLDEDTARTAASFFVMGEIGEENKMLKITDVAIVRKLEDHFDSIKSPVQLLRSHINEL